jgi:ABC-2 type transport system permease protein
MTRLYVLTRRELAAYFLSPMAYLFLGLFLLLKGLEFWDVLSFFSSGQGGSQLDVMQVFFGGHYIFWFFLIVAIPAITMRLLAEEKRTGTLEVLMTAPVSDTQVVMAKFLGAWILYLFLWLPTLGFIWILARYGNPDLRAMGAGYLGIALLGAMLIAMGLFASSLTDSQVTAAFFTAAMLIVLFFLGILAYREDLPHPWIQKVLEQMSLLKHFQSFGSGTVDSRHVVFYASATGWFLFAAIKMLESRKWR